MSVYAGGGQSTLTAVQATDPRAWPGLATITQAVAAVDRVGAGRTVGYRTPSLGTRLGTHASCGTRPAEMRGRRGLVLWIGVPTDGMGPVGTCTELTLFRDERGAIDAVLVSDTRAPASQPGPPDVVGDELRTTLTPDTATDRASWAPVLDRLTGALARSDGAGAADDACLVRGDLPTGLSDESAWRLSVPEPRGCADDWSLLVWVDDAGAIRAVDLLTGRT